MAVAQDQDIILSITKLGETPFLEPFEHAWLLDSGVPLASIEGVPAVVLRELFRDLLNLGPNYEAVNQWVTYTKNEIISGSTDIYSLIQPQDQQLFNIFQKQMTEVLNNLDTAKQADLRLWRVMIAAEDAAERITGTATFMFPADWTKYDVEEMETEVNNYSFHYILILATGEMLPANSEAEQARKTLYSSLMARMVGVER